MAFAHPLALLLIPPLLTGVVLLELRLGASPRRRLARMATRGLVIVLLVGAVSAPRITGSRERPRRLVVAVDLSAQMGPHARREATDAVADAVREADGLGVRVSLLGFADRASVVLDHENEATPIPEPPPAPRGRPAAGLAAAALTFAPGETGTVLLLTTGRGNHAGLEAAAQRIADAGIELRGMALPSEDPPESPHIDIRSLDLPSTNTVRGPFDVRAVIEGPEPVDVELLLDGKPVARGSVSLSPGAPSDVVFEDLEAEPGPHEVALVARSQDVDTRVPPALIRRLLVVEPPPQILAVLLDPEASSTRRALSAQGFVIRAVVAADLDRALLSEDEATPSEALLLDAASVLALPSDTQKRIARRVERGLGLFLEAGAAGSGDAWERLADTPLGRLLPVRPLGPPAPPPPAPLPPPSTPKPPTAPPEPIDGPGLAAERRPEEALPISLLLVLDRSGSMAGGKLAMAIEGAHRAASTLSAFDRVSVITFADESSLDVPPTSVRRLGNLRWRLAMLQADGNTDIYGALARAASVLEKESAPIRHLVLLTDGRQNATEALFSPLTRRMARAGITLTALGLGHGHDEVLLKRLVQFAPRGRYRSVETEAQLPTILTRDTQRVAEYRAREARALARLPDPGRPSEPSEDVPEPAASPPRPVPTETVPALAPLHMLRPHESTRGLDPEGLPSVGPPRPSEPLPGAALLLVRGEDEAVLAARRWGLGRILVWALPPDAAGLSTWADLGRVLVQGVRSVRAPKGAFGREPSGRILHTPEGERLALDPPISEGSSPVEVTWGDDAATRSLGIFAQGEEIPLPSAAPGTAAIVRLRPTDGSPSGPALTYLAADPRRTEHRAGDPKALADALGSAKHDGRAELLAPPARAPSPVPLWPYLLLLALFLLPLDAGLHRRVSTP